MQRHQISDRLDVDINLENGNAVIRHRDLTIGGTGVHLGLNSVYNSRDLNQQWKQSYGRDIGLKFESDRVAFHGPTGSCDEFMEDGDGGFDSPAGLNSTLTELANGHYALNYTRGEFEDEVWYFDANGWAITHADRNGNTNDFVYSNGGDLIAINDSQNRSTSLSWDDDANRPTEVTDPTGETAASYTYGGDSTRQPGTITDRAGNDIGFGYEDGYLTEITDPEGAVWELSYDSQGRVTSLTEPFGEDGATYSFDHGDGAETTVTDPGGASPPTSSTTKAARPRPPTRSATPARRSGPPTPTSPPPPTPWKPRSPTTTTTPTTSSVPSCPPGRRRPWATATARTRPSRPRSPDPTATSCPSPTTRPAT